MKDKVINQVLGYMDSIGHAMKYDTTLWYSW